MNGRFFNLLLINILLVYSNIFPYHYIVKRHWYTYIKGIKVHAWDILRMIPDEELAKLAQDTKVDYCAKVLSGERMFYLLVFSLLAAGPFSRSHTNSYILDSHPFIRKKKF